MKISRRDRDRLTPVPRKFEELARYNGECGRGIVHTIEMMERMAALQAEFDQWHEDDLRTHGWVEREGYPGEWIREG